MSSFADRLAQKSIEGEGNEVKVDWSAHATTASLGDARQAPRQKETFDTNHIDKGLPTLRGTIVDCRSGKIDGSLDIVVAVTNVTLPSDASAHIVKLPSGAIVQVGVAKWKNPVKEMIASPRTYSDVTFAVELDGILCVSVKTKAAHTVGNAVLPKDGQGNQTILQLHHVPVGATISISQVALEYRIAEKSGNAYIGSSSGLVEVFPNVPFVGDRVPEVFKTISEGPCSGFQRQLCRSLGRTTSCPLEGLVASAREDALVLSDFLRHKVQTYQNSSATIDSNRSVPLISEAAKADMLATAARLEDFGNPDRPIDTASPGNEVDFHHLFTLDGRRAHIVPLVQQSMTPTANALLVQRETCGFGVGAYAIMAMARPDDPSDRSNKLKFCSEALLAPSAQKLARTDDDKHSKSIGAMVLDVRAVNLGVKRNGEWQFHIPALSNGVAISPKQCTFSATKATKCNMKDAVGFYCFYKMPMVMHELAPYTNVAFFTTDYSPVATATGFAGIEGSDIQPAVLGDFGGSRAGDTIQNIVDLATGIKSVGLRLSVDFVKKHVVDEDGTVVTKDNYHQYGELTSDGKALQPPNPPKLETHGYVPINAIAESAFLAKIKKTPEGCGEIRYYAIFEGCSKVANSAKANADSAVGEAVLTEKLLELYPSCPDLTASICKHVAIYAVAFKKEPESTPKRGRDDTVDVHENAGDTASTSSADNLSPSKAQKASEEE